MSKISGARGPSGNERVEVVERTPVFEGFFRLDRLRLRHLRYDGSWTGEITREIFERGSSACVLLYDPHAECVVLIEQFRAAAVDAPGGPWLIEVVAGIIESAEPADAVVRREAEEEAGCQPTDLIHIGRIWLSPGGSSEQADLFVGRIDATSAGGIHGLAEEAEDIRVIKFGLDEAVAECGKGIDTAPAIMLLQWLGMNRDAVHRHWGLL